MMLKNVADQLAHYQVGVISTEQQSTTTTAADNLDVMM